MAKVMCSGSYIANRQIRNKAEINDKIRDYECAALSHYAFNYEISLGEIKVVFYFKTNYVDLSFFFYKFCLYTFRFYDRIFKKMRLFNELRQCLYSQHYRRM